VKVATSTSCVLANPATGTISLDKWRQKRALYFSRAPLAGAYHHIGIYAYLPSWLIRRDALRRDGQLPRSTVAEAEQLEQLAWMDDGVAIGVKLLDRHPPLAINTRSDYIGFCVRQANQQKMRGGAGNDREAGCG